MFALARKAKDISVTAVVSGDVGLSVAAVEHGSQTMPMLKDYHFVPCDAVPCTPDFVKKQLRPLRIGSRPCSTTMNLGDYTILSVEAPDVPATELRAAVRWQIKDLIDFHIDDAVLDVFDAPASGADQRQHNLYVVVSRMTVVKQQISALQEAELNLTTIDIPELVLRNICAYCPEDEEGMVMVYLAKERGLVVITRQSTLYLARSLDLGYDALLASADKAGDLGLDSFNAEFDRLTLEIQRSLDYYDRYFNQPSVAGIVLAPTEQPIPGLLEYLNSNLGLRASTLDLNEIVSAPQPIDLSHQAHCLLAIGAALRQEKKTL